MLEYQKECPECWAQMDYYDDVENLSFGGLCGECGHTDDKDYYRKQNGQVILITKEQAEKDGIVKVCKECWEIVYDFENDGSGLCIICQAVKQWE